RGHSVEPALILLHLLEGEPERVSQLLLADSLKLAAQTNPRTDMSIDVVRGGDLAHESSLLTWLRRSQAQAGVQTPAGEDAPAQPSREPLRLRTSLAPEARQGR